MKAIKELGRSEGWRHGATLVKLESPLKLSVDGKSRQTKMAVLCRGYLYPVNRKEQIIAEPIKVQEECEFCKQHGSGACYACGNNGEVPCVHSAK